MSESSWVTSQARLAFDQARRRAVIETILDLLRGRSHEMLSFDEVRLRLNVRAQHTLGLQTIPLDRIIGSEGRQASFDRRFLPLSTALKSRWVRVDEAMQRDVPLPPIDVYKIGELYFVRDGNHRVSVARQRGQIDIDAHVTELVIDVPLDTAISARELLLKEEYSDFLEWTRLNHLRPEQRIEFSEPGGYLELIRHINAHRYYMGLDQHREISRDEAVADWYDTVYVPTIEAIRREHALAHFPGRTEADLYRWIMEHRWYLSEQHGGDPGPAAAAGSFVARYGHRDLRDSFLEAWRRLFAGDAGD